jgi:hypothetical protein
VHEVIESTLKKRQFPMLETMQHEAIEIFRGGMQASVDGKWKASPKKFTNLFEHYFAKPIAPDAIQEAEGKIRECVKNWVESPIVKMAFDPRARWISIEELTNFTLAERYKILVVIDFAMKWVGKDGKETLILFDWKTGAASEKTDEQLYSYALFANRALHMPLENIILTPFYLYPNEYKKITNIEPARVDEVERDIVASCDEMAKKIPALLPLASDPPPDPREFPYTENRAICPYCPFQKVCQKAQYQDLTKDELALYIQ